MKSRGEQELNDGKPYLQKGTFQETKSIYIHRKKRKRKRKSHRYQFVRFQSRKNCWRVFMKENSCFRLFDLFNIAKKANPPVTPPRKRHQEKESQAKKGHDEGA